MPHAKEIFPHAILGTCTKGSPALTQNFQGVFSCSFCRKLSIHFQHCHWCHKPFHQNLLQQTAQYRMMKSTNHAATHQVLVPVSSFLSIHPSSSILGLDIRSENNFSFLTRKKKYVCNYKKNPRLHFVIKLKARAVLSSLRIHLTFIMNFVDGFSFS